MATAAAAAELTGGLLKMDTGGVDTVTVPFIVAAVKGRGWLGSMGICGSEALARGEPAEVMAAEIGTG
jgi:hypothetical protein